MNNDYNTLKDNIYNRKHVIDAIKKIGKNKVDDAYNLAYEYGHSSSASSINNYFEDLLDLLTK